MENCSLCDASLGPIIAESTFWNLVLNRNQNLLGKSFLVLNRHLEEVSQLSPAEWAGLHEQLLLATRRLSWAFQPAHFNYAFLQNLDRHVHLHIIPRYAESREFEGMTFDDQDYPSHYRVPAPVRSLSQRQTVAMLELLQSFPAPTT